MHGMHTVDFSTRAPNVAERSRQLAAFIGNAAARLRDDGHEASIRGADVGGARICSVTLGGHVIADETSARLHAVTPAIKLLFQEEGSCLVEQGTRSVTLLAGEWCAYDKGQPFRITSDGFSRQTTLTLPLGRAQAAQRWVRHMMQRYASGEGADHILHLSLVAAIGQVRSLNEGSAQMLGNVLRELAEMTLLAKHGSGEDALGDARRARVLAYVDRHLADPDLDIDRIARSLLCSKRYLHKLFLGQDATLARLIWNRRLDRCHIDLGDPALAERTITEIALGWGFNDSHHFSRLFRERFGTTPREYRKARASPSRALTGPSRAL
ncbi:MAG TPA: helix-turn-helix domain-containing protein [Sphingomonadaceae bacterium]|nr:helix-turn-helix domain-containing protein [Sphingomonadaceae bacterium]